MTTLPTGLSSAWGAPHLARATARGGRCHLDRAELLHPTLDAVAAAGLFADIGTLHLDRGYDYETIRGELHDCGLDQLDIQRRGTKVHAALCLATTVLIVGRLIDWRDRWSPA